MLEHDIDSMLADADLSLLLNPDWFESPLEQGGSRLHNDGPTCSLHANKGTEVLSAGLDPNDPEHRAVETLRRMTTAKDCPIENQNLSLHPSLIPAGAAAGYSLLPGKVFLSDEFDLLEKNILAGGSWKKYRAGMGWGIKSTGYGFIALKRAFEFYSDNCKTNWVMDVYVKMDLSRLPFTEDPCPKYLCHVFQSNNYQPRPRAPRHYIGDSPPDDPADSREHRLVCRACQEAAKGKYFNKRPSTEFARGNCDPNVAGPSMGIVRQNCDPNAAGPSTGIVRENCDPNAAGPSTRIASDNCDLNAEGPSTRIASGKEQKTAVWDNFTEVSISNGPAGKVLTLCICNCCGMAYRKTSGTSTLAKHKCCNDYLTSNQPETASGIRPPDMPSLVVPSCIGVLRHDVG